SEECVEALLVFADCAVSPQEWRQRVRKAVETATHVLGEAGLREQRGRLGETADGAAYLHALAALARTQISEDRGAQAIQTLQGVLAMDPEDPVGVRGDLLLLLLATARDDEAEDLVSAYPEEASAEWMLGRALLRRRRAMDADGVERATASLDRAIARFPEVARQLLPPSDGAGPSSRTAVDPILRQAFEDTEGALAWLSARLEGAPAPAEASAAAAPARMDVEADRRFTAREFVDEAWKAEGGRREDLARQALARWPDCADAWRALASLSRDGGDRVARLRKGKAAGLRAIGRAPDAPPAPVGDSEDARALLRTLADLADALRAAGDEEGALAEERRLLAEDPDDPIGRGVRHVARLLALGRDGDATALLAAREEDASPGWVWARVLACFRAKDRVATSFALTEATMVAPFVGPLLLARGLRVPSPEGLSADAFQAARRASDDLREAFEATPGALDWLRERTPRPPDSTRRGPSHRRRPGG
ncbi:MAG TPA: hypothetical protein VND21_05115, partial [Planctomycetota bacterium]|nr:hypothetical protein [Planctomycetota bacterium]